MDRSAEDRRRVSGGDIDRLGVELFYGFTLAGFVGGIRIFCLLWFASGAAFFVGTIGGFLFGVPKAKTELDSAKTLLAASPSRIVSDHPQYIDNTNLEEVSDWLTKIIVGLSLAQFNKIITFLSYIGDTVGKSVDPSGQYGSKVIAIGSIVIGFATGFLYYYVWTRLSLTESLRRAIERSGIPNQSSEAGGPDKFVT